MPIHRISESRRRFLQMTAFGGGAALVLSNVPIVSASEIDAVSIALLSDTHIPSSADVQARGVNMTDNLRRVIAQVVGRKARPSHLIINGDCAYLSGLPADYQNLAECLSPLEPTDIALHVTMGNHDDRQPLYDALAGQRPQKAAVMSKHISVIETPFANLFLLDSLFRVNVVTGEIGKEQIDWLAQQLDERSDKPAIVMAHHNPQFSAPPEGKPWTGMSDTESLFEVLESRQHVKAFLFGHSHHWNHSRRGRLHLVNLPPVAYVFNDSQPNGWVDAVLTADSMRLELQTFDPKHPQAADVVEIAFTG